VTFDPTEWQYQHPGRYPHGFNWHNNKQPVTDSVSAELSYDLATKPMCFLGGERGIDDPSWPSNLCCRIYELPDFQGSNMTCCTSVREQRTVRDIELFGWNNEMSSWKCGKKVSAHFCFDKAQNCEWSDSESGAGWSYNSRVGVNDSMSSLILSHYNPDKELRATLFKEPNC